MLEFAGGLSVTLPVERAAVCLRSVAGEGELARVRHVLRLPGGGGRALVARAHEEHAEPSSPQGKAVGLAEIVRDTVDQRQRAPSSRAAPFRCTRGSSTSRRDGSWPPSSVPLPPPMRLRLTPGLAANSKRRILGAVSAYLGSDLPVGSAPTRLRADSQCLARAAGAAGARPHLRSGQEPLCRRHPLRAPGPGRNRPATPRGATASRRGSGRDAFLPRRFAAERVRSPPR